MTPPAIRDAATVILLRQREETVQCLLVERGQQRGAFQGFWVFPGGVVDPEDRYAKPVKGLDAMLGCEDATAFDRAARRELEEETGIRLPDSQPLQYFAYWTTPASIQKRFATRFFLAECPRHQGECLKIDEDELVAAQWTTPQRALDGSLKLMPPTKDILQRLATCETVKDAFDLAARRQQKGIPHVLPEINVVGHKEVVRVPTDR